MTFEGFSATGSKVLTVAEELFAEHGYTGVSLRQITSAAKVNLAAVNYHHSDKESLYSEIIIQRLRQLGQVRLEMLSAAEASAGAVPVPLHQLSDIVAEPLLRPKYFGAAGRRLLGRLLIEPLPFTAPIIAREFQPAMARCGQALRRHAPAVAPAKFLWRLSLLVGALHHAAAALHDMETHTSGICRNDDANAALESFRETVLAAFPANGFRP